MRFWLAICALMAVLMAAPVVAEPAPDAEGLLRLSPAEAREAGLRAMQNQRPDIALQVALALIARDGADPFAHFLMATALSALNRLPEAQAAGKRAFRFAQSPEQKFQAARATALAAYDQNRLIAAQWWLRRTIRAAPDAARRERSVAEFQSVRDKNPLVLGLRFAAAPSDNVNSGSSSAFNTIDGVPIVGTLSPDAQKLSGLVFEAGLDLQYRLRKAATGNTSLGLVASIRDVRLSRAAKTRLGAVNAPDLASQQIEISLRQSYTPKGAKYRLSFAGALGRRWKDGVEPQDLGRVTLGYAKALGTRDYLEISTSAEQRSRTGPLPRGDRVYSLRGSVVHRLKNADRLTGTLYSSGYDTARFGQSSTTLGFQIGYELARAVGPLRLTVNFGAQRSVFRGYSIAGIPVPGGRQDDRAFAEVLVLFPKIEFAGFAPQLSLRRQMTGSNVSRFDTLETSATLGIKSTF